MNKTIFFLAGGEGEGGIDGQAQTNLSLQLLPSWERVNALTHKLCKLCP